MWLMKEFSVIIYSRSHNQLRLLNMFLTQMQDITLGVALGSATQIAMFVVRNWIN